MIYLTPAAVALAVAFAADAPDDVLNALASACSDREYWSVMDPFLRSREVQLEIRADLADATPDERADAYWARVLG